MRRPVRILLWCAAVLVALPLVAVAALFIALNTGPGRSLAASQIAALTGGAVRLQGLSGRFPDRLRLAHLEVHDATGPWLLADDVALDWSPTALLHRQALVDRIEAARLQLPRLPASSPAAPDTPAQPSKPFTLPVRVTLLSLVVSKAELGAPVLGTSAAIALAGHADLPSLQAGTAALQATRLDGPGTYALRGAITPTTIDARLEVSEPEQGLVATLAKLPAIGPLHLEATTAGPRTALVTKLTLAAGPLAAEAHGTVDLDNSAAVLDVTARAPAMRPAQGIGWRAIAIDAHVAGPFTTPDATGHVHVEALEAAGAGLDRLDATLAGNAGQVSLDAAADRVRIPGPAPELLAAAPLRLNATARLDDPARPVRFALAHPLVTLNGTATTGTAMAADLALTLPDLAAFAGLAGTPIAGQASATLHAALQDARTTLDGSGTVTLTAAPGPAVAPARPRRTLRPRRKPRRQRPGPDPRHHRRRPHRPVRQRHQHPRRP